MAAETINSEVHPVFRKKTRGEVIRVPSRMRDVSRASAPSVTQASVGPGSPSPPIVR